MLNKKLANIFLFFILNINLFAHKIPSVDISLTYLENDFFKNINSFRCTKRDYFCKSN